LGAWLADLATNRSRGRLGDHRGGSGHGTRLRHEVEHNIDPGSPSSPKRCSPRSPIPTRRDLPPWPATSRSPGQRLLGWERAKRRSVAEMAVHIGHRLPGFTRTLGATGAGAARPMTTDQLAACCRVAYDPASDGAIELTSLTPPALRGQTPDRSGTGELGPLSPRLGISASWFMAKAQPATCSRTPSPAGLLPTLTSPQAGDPRLSTSRSGSAAKTVERDRLDAQFAASGKKFGGHETLSPRPRPTRAQRRRPRGWTRTVRTDRHRHRPCRFRPRPRRVAMENMGNASRSRCGPPLGARHRRRRHAPPRDQSAQPPPRTPGRTGDAVIAKSPPSNIRSTRSDASPNGDAATLRVPSRGLPGKSGGRASYVEAAPSGGRPPPGLWAVALHRRVRHPDGRRADRPGPALPRHSLL